MELEERILRRRQPVQPGGRAHHVGRGAKPGRRAQSAGGQARPEVHGLCLGAQVFRGGRGDLGRGMDAPARPRVCARAPARGVRILDRRARGGRGPARRPDQTRRERRRRRPPWRAFRWTCTRPSASPHGRSRRASPTCGAWASRGSPHIRRANRWSRNSRRCGSCWAPVRSGAGPAPPDDPHPSGVRRWTSHAGLGPRCFTDENLCCLAVARANSANSNTATATASSQAYVLLGEILGRTSTTTKRRSASARWAST